MSDEDALAPDPAPNARSVAPPKAGTSPPASTSALPEIPAPSVSAAPFTLPDGMVLNMSAARNVYPHGGGAFTDAAGRRYTPAAEHGPGYFTDDSGALFHIMPTVDASPPAQGAEPQPAAQAAPVHLMSDEEANPDQAASHHPTKDNLPAQAASGLGESVAGTIDSAADFLAKHLNPVAALGSMVDASQPIADLMRMAVTGKAPSAPIQPYNPMPQPGAVSTAAAPLLASAPTTLPGQIARIGGEFAPGLLAGPGGDAGALGQILARTGNVVLPAAGHSAAKWLAQEAGASPEVQSAAGMLGAGLGGLGAAGIGGAVSKAPVIESAAGIDPANPVPAPIAVKAAQYVASKLGGIDPVMADAANSGKNVMLAEHLGNPGKLALKIAAAKSPTVNADLTTAVDQRAGEMQGNLADSFGSASGVDPVAAKGDFEAQIAAARKDMKPKYQDVLSSPDPVMSPALAEIARRPAVQTALRMAATSLRNAGKDPAAIGLKIDPETGEVMLGAPTTTLPPGIPEGATPAVRAGILQKLGLSEPVGEPLTETQPTLEAWDLTKKAMQDQVKRDAFGHVITHGQEGRFNSDTNTAARDLTAALREVSPEYGEVLDQAGDYIRLQPAFERGQDHLFNDKVSAREGNDYFSGLGSPEQDAYRAGMANAISLKTQANSLNPTAFKKPVVQGKLNYALGDSAPDFLSDVQHYAAMNGNGSFMKPGAGSVTGPMRIESDAQDAAGHGGGVGGLVRHAAADFVTAAAPTFLFAPHAAIPAGTLSAVSQAAGRAGMKIANTIRTSPEAAQFQSEVGRLLMSHMTPEQFQDYVRSLKAPTNAALPNAVNQSAVGALLGSMGSVNSVPSAPAGPR